MAKSGAEHGNAGRDSARATEALSGHIAAGMRPTEAQRRYPERGMTQPGGKLPLFDRDGPRSAQTHSGILRGAWLGRALGAKSDQARLAGLPADRGRLSRARRRAAGHAGCDNSAGPLALAAR